MGYYPSFGQTTRGWCAGRPSHLWREL